jgi:hypothetical protein
MLCPSEIFLAAFRKPIVPDRLIRLAGLRYMTVMREDDVGRRRKRELNAVLWHTTEFRHACGADIFDAVVVRAGCDADRRLGHFVVNLAVGAGHEPLPLARNILRVSTERSLYERACMSSGHFGHASRIPRG